MTIFFPHYCDVTPTMEAAAWAEANRIGLRRNSIRNGGGNFVGCLGEQALLVMLPGAVSDNTFDHDVTYLGKTFECKTKVRICPPQAGYDASVTRYNTTQKTDYYAFMSAEYAPNTQDIFRVYFCGFITPEDFYKKATYVEEGDYDQSNDWHSPVAGYSLHYSQLDRCL